MPLFPKVTSPCPYKSQLSTVMDGDFCRMCQRQVFDLTAFSDGERRTFLAGCAEEVCVSYRVPLRAAMAAAALAVASPAVAQDVAAPAADMPPAAESDIVIEETFLIVGGIRNPAGIDLVGVDELVDVEGDRSVPELPVVYEDVKPSLPEPVDRTRKSM